MWGETSNHAMPYLTPDASEIQDVNVLSVPVPGGIPGRARALGALAALKDAFNWQEYGTATPEETAAAFTDALALLWRSGAPNTDYTARVLTHSGATIYCHYPLSVGMECLSRAGRALAFLAGGAAKYRDGMGDGLASFYFDGGDNRLSFPMLAMSSDFPYNAGAMVAWAKLDAGEYDANLRWHRIVHFTDYLGQSLEVYRRGGTVSDFSLTRTTSGIARTVTATIAPGSPEFTCFGADWSTTTGVLEFFINGVSVGTAPAGLGWRSAPTVGRVGGRTSDHFFHGSIAHVAMWTAPLGAAGHAALGVL